MQETLAAVARGLAMAAEVAAMAVFAVGLLRAGVGYVGQLLRRADPFPPEAIRLSIARSISLALELLFVASLLRTVGIEPSWQQLGRIAALIAIRAVVGLLLRADIREEPSRRRADAAAGKQPVSRTGVTESPPPSE